MADDAADCAFAPDQDGLDIAAILVWYHVGNEAGAAGEIHRLDIVTGAVEQVGGARVDLREMRLDQRVVGRGKAAQQVVERAVANLDRRAVSRMHQKSSI